MQDIQTLPVGSILHGETYEYRIEKVLGQGSFGITYKASVRLSGSLGKLQSSITVAVKEFFMKDFNTRHGTSVDSGSDSSLHHKYRQDFIKEARNIAKLDSRHIVKVLEAFEENNTAYFSMEYIDGGSLNDHIYSNGGLSERESLECALQISEALSYMHSNMMLHLDLKPLNIMLRSTGELILIDFGLSKQFNADGEPESSTRIGNGTVGYAPLEQANYRREDGFSPTLDIYAFGATLYKMLTGKTPPEASSVLNDGLPERELKQRGISEDVISLMSWAMEPMRKKRPQSMSEVEDEIKRILKGMEYFEKLLKINNRTTAVKIHYEDGSVATAISYDFIAKRNFASFTIHECYSSKQRKSSQIPNFDWERFASFFNGLKLKVVPVKGETKRGAFYTRIEIEFQNGSSIMAEQQAGGISSYGTLSGDVRPLHSYIETQTVASAMISNYRSPRPSISSAQQIGYVAGAEGRSCKVDDTEILGFENKGDFQEGQNRFFKVGDVNFAMKYVKGGSFFMGAHSKKAGGLFNRKPDLSIPNYDDEAYVGESPVHSVTLSSYRIGETEVTQALWTAVMGNNPSHFKGDNLPVENVSWNDCQTFIKKLNKKTGQNFRLPTEAEWEYAARGGNRSNHTKYSGSSNIGDVAWYRDNSGFKAHAVKGKLPNELGLYDMSGNVWEWCQDWYGSYSSSSQMNPTGPASGSYRVYRGGSWYSIARYCRVSFHSGDSPDARYNYLGLRLAL